MKNKKILVIYCVTLKHYLNFKSIEKYLNFHTYYLFENDITTDDVSDKIIYRELFEDFIKNNYENISLCIFSTCQIRLFPINILHIIYSYKIKCIAIQETNQMFLHELRMNNYLLPMNFYLLNSSFEKEKFLRLNYDEESLIVTGYPFFNNQTINNKHKDSVIIIFNASNISNPLSLETSFMQKEILDNLIKYKNNNYKIFVKFHPSDDKKYVDNIKEKYKRINFHSANNYEENLLDNYDIILTTGYSQLLLESIIFKKKIFLIETNTNKDFIEKFNFNYLKAKDLSTNFDFNKNHLHNNYEEIFSFHLHIDIKTAKKNIINFLNNNSIKNFKNNEISIIENLLWNKNLSFKKNTNKNDKLDIFKSKFNFLLNGNFNQTFRTQLLITLNDYRKNKIYDSLIIFLIKQLVFNNIQPNKDEFIHILMLNKIYLINYFYWEIQNFLNLLYINNDQSYFKNFNKNLNLVTLNYHPLNDLKKIILIRLRNNYFIKKNIFLRKLYYYFFKIITFR